MGGTISDVLNSDEKSDKVGSINPFLKNLVYTALQSGNTSWNLKSPQY